MRYVAFSSVSGLSLGYGDTAAEALQSGLLEAPADQLRVVDCGKCASAIWHDNTRLEAVPRRLRGAAGDRVRAVVMGALALLLSGCANYHRQMACRAEVGPEPDTSLMLFGLMGAMAMQVQPEHQVWTGDLDACVARKVAEQP